MPLPPEASGMTDTDEARLEARIEALESALRDLRDELSPDDGSARRLRPPSPSEMLQMTREYGIPAAITALEAQIRALELCGEVLRVSGVGDSAVPDSETTRERLTETGRATLTRMDDALDRIEEEMTDGGLPDDPELRDLLAEVRELQAEVDSELDAIAETPDLSTGESVRIDVESDVDRKQDDSDGAEDFESDDDR